MPYLSLCCLEKRYRKTVAVAGVSLDVERGESVALLGPSGCGKTTTLRMLAGLIAPDRGTIHVDGTDITSLPAHRRNMGYVFQSYALFPHMDVARNIGFGLDERRVPRASHEAQVIEALRMVRLEGLERRRPRELSGGQQQRVALARALVIRPSVLLLDESLSNLDAKLRETMRQEIRDIQRSLSITTLFVTHDQVEALTMCDRIAVMNQGHIEQVGTPTEIYERPATRFVANFVGRMNILATRRASNGSLSIWGMDIPHAHEQTGEPELFVRPQRIRIVPGSEAIGEGTPTLTGRIERSIFVGDHWEVVIAGPDGQLIVHVPSGNPPPPDRAEVRLVWNASDTLFFPKEIL